MGRVKHVRIVALDPAAGFVTLVAAALLLAVATAVSAAAAAKPAAAKPAAAGRQTHLFDGKHLGQWEVIQKYDFKRHGKVYPHDGAIILTAGAPGTGIRWKGKPPRVNYEVALQAKRVQGEDFFCGLTFPVGAKALTLVVGGWGGSVTGLSSIDGEPAVENETCRYVDYQQDRWYRIRVRVTPTRVAVWLDDKKIINLETKNRQLSLYWEVEPCLPLGIATWRTTAAIRAIELRRVEKVEGRGLRVQSD
jgi:hypothetical protein